MPSTDDETATVRTVFSWSYQGLPDHPARVFRAFGVHPGQDADAPVLAAAAGLGVADTRAAILSLLSGDLVTTGCATTPATAACCCTPCRFPTAPLPYTSSASSSTTTNP